MITWLVHRFAIGAEWKIESAAEEKTRQHLKYIQEMFKCTSYNLSETSIRVFLKFHFIEKRKWLCTFVQMFGCAVRSRGKQLTRTAFFYGEPNSSQTFWKHLEEVQVYDWSYNLTETSNQCKYLHFKLIENRNSCAHLSLQMFWCVVPSGRYKRQDTGHRKFKRLHTPLAIPVLTFDT